MRVILSVTNDLVTDQRVHRACTALREAGWQVLLVGRRLPESSPIHRDYSTSRMRLLFRKKAIFYAEYNIRLFFKLLFSRADLFYSNDTDTLPANWLAARIRRKPILFDAHELFPEVPELVGRPRVKAFWTAIEDRILPRLARRPHSAAVTVCHSIADIYLQRYNLPMAVVRNVPLYDNRDSNSGNSGYSGYSGNSNNQAFILYQGAVNIGRGIEWVIDAMPYLPEYRFLIAGVGDEYENLRRYAKEIPNVVFLGRLEPDELRQLTPSASLGMSLLENRGLNYYYALPNRIADFVRAGVPILATDFPEIRAVIEKYGIGRLLPPQIQNSKFKIQNSKHLAAEIRATIEWWNSIPLDERAARLSRAAADLNYQNDKKILINTINTIMFNV